MHQLLQTEVRRNSVVSLNNLRFQKKKKIISLTKRQEQNSISMDMDYSGDFDNYRHLLSFLRSLYL